MGSPQAETTEEINGVSVDEIREHYLRPNGPGIRQTAKDLGVPEWKLRKVAKAEGWIEHKQRISPPFPICETREEAEANNGVPMEDIAARLTDPECEGGVSQAAKDFQVSQNELQKLDREHGWSKQREAARQEITKQRQRERSEAEWTKLNEARDKVEEEFERVESGMEELDESLQGLTEERGQAAREYWRQTFDTIKTSGKWVKYLGDDDIIREKIDKSPPHYAAITFNILSDQGLKRLEKMRELIEEIADTLDPPQPVFEINAVDADEQLRERGLGVSLRFIEYESDGQAAFAPTEREVDLGGERVRLPGKVTLPVEVLELT